jgi:hypothetical protein
MKHRTLIKKQDEGQVEVLAWSEDHGKTYADVVTYHRNGTSKREVVEVTNIIKDKEE